MERQNSANESCAPEQAPRYPGLERLICLALADPEFAAQLLADPADAVQRSARMLRLSHEEHTLAITITGAGDIPDFAARLYRRIRRSHGRR
jgi:hypothetical protein